MGKHAQSFHINDILVFTPLLAQDNEQMHRNTG